MAALVQTIKVVDQSGKAVSTSKHLVNVFKEAKAAYQERKAEVVASRSSQKRITGKTQRPILRATVEDDRLQDVSPRRDGYSQEIGEIYNESRRSSGSIRTVSSRSGSRSPSTIYPSSYHRFSQDLTRSAPSSPGIPRASTTEEIQRDHHALDYRRPVPTRSRTSPDIDMALAYGDLPPSASGTLARGSSPDEMELKPLVGKVKRILEEADCLHYSASSIINSLQKNPEAMAAVALTLAEISNLVSKMAPGAVMALKGSAPAVFALLASPQFLIAGGVALGVTVVAFGGYKIIKRIKAKREGDKEGGMDEMMEVVPEIGQIDAWRRGISDAEQGSAGTSVDGEFITPQAHALSRHNLAEQERVMSAASSKHGSNDDSTVRTEQSGSTRAGRKSEKSSRKSERKASDKARKEEAKSRKEVKIKAKRPSPLRLMFQ